MELRDFIEHTLTQIVEGVHSSQERTRRLGGIVNPTMNQFNEKTTLNYVGTRISKSEKKIIFPVEFNVSLSAEETSAQSGKADLKVYVLSAGGGTESKSTESNKNQVKFVVPVLLPYDSYDFQPQKLDELEQPGPSEFERTTHGLY